MKTRRSFLANMATVAGTALLPMSAKAMAGMLARDSGLLISTPNPCSKHLSLEVAKQICIDADNETYMFGGLFLNLRDYKTASLEALRCLHRRKWEFADFGLAMLTPEMSIAILEMPIQGSVTFHHLERLTPEIAGQLVVGNRLEDGHTINNIVKVAPSVVHALGESTCASSSNSEGFALSGNFTIDEALANALAHQPCDIYLEFASVDQALTDPNAARALAFHQGEHMGIEDRRGFLTPENGKAPYTNPFSGTVLAALASNPAKRARVIEPTLSDNQWLGHWRIELG